MTDKPPPRDRLKDILSSDKKTSHVKKETETEGGEDKCEAFGYLRGLRDASASIEFRFRDGNSTWFSYGLLGSWRFNPSEGLLLTFSGDLVYLVLIRGQQPGQTAYRRGDQPYPCRAAKAPGALGSRDDERGNRAGGRERAYYRLH